MSAITWQHVVVAVVAIPCATVVVLSLLSAILAGDMNEWRRR